MIKWLSDTFFGVGTEGRWREISGYAILDFPGQFTYLRHLYRMEIY